MAGRSLTQQLRYADGVRSLDAEEREELRDLVERLAPTHVEGEVILVSPLYPYLSYGPAAGHETTPVATAIERSLIKFGPVPHVARLPADHPLIAGNTATGGVIRGILRDHPEVFVLDPPATTRRVYACPDCDAELATKALLASHQGSAHKLKPEPRKAKVKATTRPIVRSVPCPSCDQMFVSTGALMFHTRARHPGAVAAG